MHDTKYTDLFELSRLGSPEDQAKAKKELRRRSKVTKALIAILGDQYKQTPGESENVKPD